MSCDDGRFDVRTKRILSALLAVPLVCVFVAQAGDYNGVTVTAEKGSIQKIGDELVVIFNQVGTGNLVYNLTSKFAKAEFFC